MFEQNISEIMVFTTNALQIPEDIFQIKVIYLFLPHVWKLTGTSTFCLMILYDFLDISWGCNQGCTSYCCGAAMLLPSGNETETGCIFVPSSSSASSTSADTLVPLQMFPIERRNEGENVREIQQSE